MESNKLIALVVKPAHEHLAMFFRFGKDLFEKSPNSARNNNA